MNGLSVKRIEHAAGCGSAHEVGRLDGRNTCTENVVQIVTNPEQQIGQ